MADSNPLGSATHAVPANAQCASADARACASQEVRKAQVELYCDHRDGALSAIRRAKHALEEIGSPSAFVGLAALDEAAWHARNNHTTLAVDLLGAAKDRLDR
jgi:hypothetical protein